MTTFIALTNVKIKTPRIILTTVRATFINFPEKDDPKSVSTNLYKLVELLFKLTRFLKN